MDRDAYLGRIGYRGGREPNAVNLAALVRAHRLAVPYETLDLWRRRRTTLQLEEIYDKIVTRRRGGYCFELNGLFNALLLALGYDVREYFARWIDGETAAVPMRRHRIERVLFPGGESQLADVGMGQLMPLEPLDYRLGLQPRPEAVYGVVRDPGLGFVLEQHLRDGVRRLYSWDEAPQTPDDFGYAHYALTHQEESPFRKTLLVHLRLPDGTRALFTAPNPQRDGKTDFFFTRSSAAGRVVQLVPRDRVMMALEREFGILPRLDPGVAAAATA